MKNKMSKLYEITTLDGSGTNFGRWISIRLNSRVSSSRGYKLIEIKHYYRI